VVDVDGKLLGMVSRLDVLRQVAAWPVDMPQLEQKQPVSGRLAGEVMTKAIPMIGEQADLAAVVASFLTSGEHRVIVVDEAGHPVGLISDSDVIGRIQPGQRRGVLGALRGLVSPPPITITAREMMSAGAETISPETTVVDAIRRMVTAQRKWLVVVAADGKAIGLVDREIALESLIR
jgi:CBS domain-containing protein